MFAHDSKSGMAHIKKYKEDMAERKAAREGKQQQRSEFVSQYYNFDKGEHLTRFVGNFFTSCFHSVSNAGKLGYMRLFPDEAFDSKVTPHISKKIVCANWDFEKSEHLWEGSCVICRLNAIARDIAKSPQFKGQSQEDQARWNSLKSKTAYQIEHVWNIIDRKHPDVKAYLMASMKNDLFLSLMGAVHDKWEPRYFAGDEDGVDVSITVTEAENGRWKYTAAIALNGVQVAMTPLTAEEKSWALHNLADKLGPGKVPDQKVVQSLLLPQWQAILSTDEEDVTPAPAPKPTVSVPTSSSGKQRNRPF